MEPIEILFKSKSKSGGNDDDEFYPAPLPSGLAPLVAVTLKPAPRPCAGARYRVDGIDIGEAEDLADELLIGFEEGVSW